MSLSYSTIVYGFTVNTGSPSCCTDDRPSISLLEVTPRLRGLANGEHPRYLTAPLVCSSFFIIPMLRHRNSVHQSKTLRREVMEICGDAHLFDRHRARPSRSCLQSISSEWAYIRGAECHVDISPLLLPRRANPEEGTASGIYLDSYCD